MLDERGIEYAYREYREDPLSGSEISKLLDLLGVSAHEVLRRNDRAYRELGLTGAESERELVDLMAIHPTLLQRPIGVHEGRAAVGRPPERLLDLV